MVVRDRRIHAGRIARIEASHRAQQPRRILGRAREHPGLIQARGKRDHPVARYAPVGRLEPGEVGERRRLADRSPGVGAARRRRKPRADRDGRAPRGSARHACRVPGVAHRAVETRLVRRAHRELVHVGLAQQHRTGRSPPLDDGRVVGCDEVAEHARPAGREDAVGAEDVLVRDRHAGERSCLTPRASRIGLARIRERPLGRHCHEGVQSRPEPLDPREQVTRDLHARKASAPRDPVARFRRR